MRKLIALAAFIGAAAPGFSQDVRLQSIKPQDLKATILKHFKTLQDFTLKVAAAMPDADYGFRLTAPQMSFGGQMVHPAQGFDYFLSPIGLLDHTMHRRASTEMYLRDKGITPPEYQF
jgi:hypothetical protein